MIQKRAIFDESSFIFDILTFYLLNLTREIVFFFFSLFFVDKWKLEQHFSIFFFFFFFDKLVKFFYFYRTYTFKCIEIFEVLKYIYIYFFVSSKLKERRATLVNTDIFERDNVFAYL